MSFLSLVTLPLLAIVVYLITRNVKKQVDARPARPRESEELKERPAAPLPADTNDAEGFDRAQLKGQLSTALECYRRDYVSISPVSRYATTPWQSKLGGVPYWPADMPPPVNSSGKPLYMIAQLNFREIPALEPFPASGILQFFIGGDELYGYQYGNDFKSAVELNANGENSRVVFHPNPQEDVSQLNGNLPTPGKDAFFPVNREYILNFALASETPPPTDHHFQEALESIEGYEEIPADVIEALERYPEAISSECAKLGGYADFAQEDPRNSLEPGQLVQLLQITSCRKAGIDIGWGDFGTAHWFIHEEQLSAGELAACWYYWDSY